MSTSIEERIRNYASVLDRAADEERAGLIEQEHLHPAHDRRPVLLVSAIAVVAASVVTVMAVTTRSNPHQIASAPISTNDQPDPSTTPEPSTSAASPNAATWTDIAPSPMTGREDSAAVWTGTEFLVWGGRVADFLYQQGAAYDPVTDTWREITPNQWAGVGTATVWTGTKMVVLFKNGGVAYDPATDSWSESDVPVIELNQSFEDASWTGTEVLAIGARETDGGIAFVAPATLDPGRSLWHAGTMSDTPWSQDLQFAATPDGYAVWRPTPDGRGGQAWSYDVVADTWTELPPLTIDGDRSIESSLAVSTSGGWTVVLSTATGSAMTATLDGTTWRTADLPIEITPTQGAPIGDGKTVVFGTTGGVATAVMLAGDGSMIDTWTLDPQATTGQALAWNGQELFVWGGRIDDHELSAQGRMLVP